MNGGSTNRSGPMAIRPIRDRARVGLAFLCRDDHRQVRPSFERHGERRHRQQRGDRRLAADSVGFLYSSAQHETSVTVNTAGAAESPTGASAISPMLELAGSGNLIAANFKI